MTVTARDHVANQYTIEMINEKGSLVLMHDENDSERGITMERARALSIAV